MKPKPIKIAVVGNPNCGKSSLFNALTGLDQKVGNFPGVTVDITEGTLLVDHKDEIHLLDFPGAYSIHSNTQDEFLLTTKLIDPSYSMELSGILYVLDIRYLNKQLLLLSQIFDLGYQVLVALTFTDYKEEHEIQEVISLIQEKLNCDAVPVNAKSGLGVELLKGKLIHFKEYKTQLKTIYEIPELYKNELRNNSSLVDKTLYHRLLLKHYHERIGLKDYGLNTFSKSESIQQQIQETMSRYNVLEHWIESYSENENQKQRAHTKFTRTIDSFAIHPIWGYVIFTVLMVIVFQAVFSWASFPMDWIEGGFSLLTEKIKSNLPQHWLVHLLTDGILAGLSGIVVFVPQIAILFFLINLLEEVGYMARVVYLFDRILRFFGLNGRSIVGLISSGACAVPAIMSTRTISNWKDRLTTMFVLPLIPCSARIPVYAALVGFIVPYERVWIFFNSQGLVFMGLYLLGIGVALISASLVNRTIQNEEKSYLLIQLPDYQLPYLKQIVMNVWHKVYSFISEAGKVIIVISIVLWFLCNYSWPGTLKGIEEQTRKELSTSQLSEKEKEGLVSAKKLEHSFAGEIGRWMEPVIEPLGFDWKIGIAIITSFAAREVFVGTMATIYNVVADDEPLKLRERMAAETRPDGTRFYDIKTSISLTLFYAFALQCISTMAVMKRETRGWKWPLIQFAFMAILAYISSFLVYQLA
ncbi:MAG TPA: ferrous iron transport protein B [Saprospiraceae bacterium]|nr:ferrous iron transport protein B [Saprospiraceae bacterium]